MKQITKYIIQDWTSNTLQYTEKFNFGSYGNERGVPKTFKSFDDAAEYLDLKYSEEERQDLYVEEILI